MSRLAKSSGTVEPCVKAAPVDDSASTAFRQLAVTFLKLQRRIEEMLAPAGLVLSQFEALVKIGMKPGVIQQELVRHLLVTKGNVGALIDRLEKGGLVERRVDPDDRRANRLYLTDAGAELVGGLVKQHRAWVRETFKPLGAAERRTLESLLSKIEPE